MDEKKQAFRPRFFIIIVIAVIAGQIYMTNKAANELARCKEFLNVQTLMLNALVHVLDEKKIMTRQELIDEADRLSPGFRKMVEHYEKMQQADNDSLARP